MIASFQEANNEKELSINSIKSEKINEIEEYLSKQKDVETKSDDSSDEIFSQTFSSQLIKIDLENGSKGTQPQLTTDTNGQHQYSSLVSGNLSHAEECIQKDVLQEIEHSSMKKNTNSSWNNSNIEDHIVNLSNNESFGNNTLHNISKNYVLKSALCNDSNASSNVNTSSQLNTTNNEVENIFAYFMPTQENTTVKGNNAIKGSLNNSGTNIIMNNININNHIVNNNNVTENNQTHSPKEDIDNIIPQKKQKSKTIQMTPPISMYINSPLQPQNNNMFICNSNKGHQSLPINKSSSPIASTNSYTPSFLIQMQNGQNVNYDIIPFQEIINNCYYLAKNQSGCRYLQKKIQEHPNIASDLIFPVIKDKIIDLTLDAFGNYFIQKVIEYLSLTELNEIFTKYLSVYFLKICFSSHGTRVIQKLLERVYIDEYIMSLFNTLFYPNLLELIVNQNSTHIVIKYVSLVKYPQNEPLVQFLCENALTISTHKHSCCTLQKCIGSVDLYAQKKMLLMSIAQISDQLFNDQFGNYITQFALSFEDRDVNMIIIQKYFFDFFTNISQKCSSNVFEKCIEHCDIDMKHNIIRNLCNQNMVNQLLFNMYGNYVLQKAMQVAHEPYRTMFIEMVAPLLDKLPMFPFGNIVIHKLTLNFPELTKVQQQRNQQRYYSNPNMFNYQNQFTLQNGYVNK